MAPGKDKEAFAAALWTILRRFGGGDSGEGLGGRDCADGVSSMNEESGGGLAINPVLFDEEGAWVAS